MSFNRRRLLLGGTALTAIAAAGMIVPRQLNFAQATEGNFEITRTEAEWRAILDDASYRVLREEDTEYPFTSPLLAEHRPGTFQCKGCELPLFDASTKYESGTGWPSFYEPLENAVAQSTDTLLGYERNEVHCRRCGGHLGHVFDDGPPPTGLRYCMNGLALTFVAKSA